MNSSRGAGNRLASFLALIAVLAGGAILAMNPTNPINITLFVIALLFALFIPQALMVANQWERAVVLRNGRLQGIKGPGLFLILPIFDRVSSWLDQRIQTTEFNA